MNLDRNPFGGMFDSLETLADTISEVLRCPVTIEDANHRLLAYSSHDSQTDAARIATIIGRRVPEKVINRLRREGVIQYLSNSDEPIRVSAIPDVGLGNRVAIAIRKKNDILGYIWVLDAENSLDDRAMDLIKKATQAAKTKLLQLQARKRTREEEQQEFFWQLLTGQLKTNSLIKEKAKKLSLKLPDSYRVLVFEFPDEISVDLYRRIHDLFATPQHVRIVCNAIDRNQLILLSTPRNPEPSKRHFIHFILDFINRMKDRFRIAPIEAGAGSLYYENYTNVEIGYQEALTALQIKRQFPNETKTVYHFEDLGFYRYLPSILGQRPVLLTENPHLKKLRDYDRVHDTSLLKTLEVYLSCDSNIRNAANILHVHVNTLNYRLTRISEIGNINLKDMDQKVSLYIDLKIENLVRHSIC